MSQIASLAKSILHNIGVVLVGLIFAFVCTKVDPLFGINRFESDLASLAGWILLVGGFLLRVWATFHFYEHRMKVISLEPQGALITSGPYRWSRNPLYLGGNVFVFFGGALLFGTPTGLIVTTLHLVLLDMFIRQRRSS